jgi:hypothetical protein
MQTDKTAVESGVNGNKSVNFDPWNDEGKGLNKRLNEELCLKDLITMKMRFFIIASNPGIVWGSSLSPNLIEEGCVERPDRSKDLNSTMCVRTMQTLTWSP